MDQFNKAVSFVLGLVVVVVFIAVASGRINLKGKLPTLSKAKTTPTVTPTRAIRPTQTITVSGTSNGTGTKTTGNTTTKGGVTNNGTVTTKGGTAEYHSYQTNGGNVGDVSNIPATGPALLFPIAMAAFGGGIFLKKKSE